MTAPILENVTIKLYCQHCHKIYDHPIDQLALHPGQVYGWKRTFPCGHTIEFGIGYQVPSQGGQLVKGEHDFFIPWQVLQDQVDYLKQKYQLAYEDIDQYEYQTAKERMLAAFKVIFEWLSKYMLQLDPREGRPLGYTVSQVEERMEEMERRLLDE